MAKAEHRSVDEPRSPVDIWSQYPSFTESKLFHEYCSRLTAGRDMHVIVTAASETGVGKTTLAFALALLWDQHGWTADKATFSPREYDLMYDNVQPGAVLLLDEVQNAVDSRRATSKDNVELSQAFAANRYMQVFGIMTAPSKGWVDGRIGADAADYWLQAQETPDGKPKGQAKVYRLKRNEHYESSYKKRTETISWPVLDSHPEMQALNAMKVERDTSDYDSKYVHRDEVEELKSNYWKKCSNLSRYHFVRAMYRHGLTQEEVAQVTRLVEDDSDGDIKKLGQGRISDLVNADSFDEVYSS